MHDKYVQVYTTDDNIHPVFFHSTCLTTVYKTWDSIFI